jgi:ubiquinone biosynthesis protein
MELAYPKPGGAPPAPPLPDIQIGLGKGWRYAAAAALGAGGAFLVQLVTQI